MVAGCFFRDSLDHPLQLRDRRVLLGVQKVRRLFPPDHEKHVHDGVMDGDARGLAEVQVEGGRVLDALGAAQLCGEAADNGADLGSQKNDK